MFFSFYNRTRITCFECNQLIPREELKPDRGFQNDMKDLFIFCILCDWSDVLKNYQVILFSHSCELLSYIYIYIFICYRLILILIILILFVNIAMKDLSLSMILILINDLIVQK